MNSADSPEWQAFLESLPREEVQAARYNALAETDTYHETGNDIGVFRLVDGSIEPLVRLPELHGCDGCIANGRERPDANVPACNTVPDCDGVVWARLTPTTYARYIAHKLSGGAS